MPLTLPALDFLASPRGVALLARLTGEDLGDAHLLRLLTVLRREYAADEAGAALELARLRVRARDKFGEAAAHMFFTRDALEQASDPQVRAWRAARLTAPGASVADMGCGIGSDSFAFAQRGARVVGCDLDPVRVAVARLNAAALGLDARFEIADIRDLQPQADLLFFDPARRDDEGRRLYSVEQYVPPFSLVRGWMQPGRGVAAKLSPGVELAQVKGYGGEVVFLSVAGALKEALWVWGRAPLPAASLPVAVLFVDGIADEWPRSAAADGEAQIAEPGAWLIEPDAALIRAGAVREAAALWGAFQLDETIAYLTGHAPPATPWARAWRVHEWMPFSLKRLRAALRARGVGAITVKKRGSAITPEALIAGLKLKGQNRAGVVLTRLRGEPIVLITEEQPDPG